MAGAQDGEEEGLRLGQALFEVDMIFLKQIRADPTVSTGIAVTAVINLPASGGRKEFVYVYVYVYVYQINPPTNDL